MGGNMPSNMGDAGGQANDSPTWVLPKDWSAVAATPPVVAAYNASSGPDPVQVTVVAANGDLLANINRWRGQLKLEPVSAEEGNKLLQPIEVSGQTVGMMVDLTGAADAAGTQTRFMVAIFPHGQTDWFFKMKGAAAKVESQKENFNAFVRSVEFGSMPVAPTMAPPAVPPAVPAAAQPPALRPLTYVLPSGWAAQASTNDSGVPGLQRAATIEIGEAGDNHVEVTVTEISGSFGTEEANISMWRGQVGLAPLPDNKGMETHAITISGVTSKWIDLTGPAIEGKKPQRLIVCVAKEGEGGVTWFIKMHGATDAVAQQRAAFEAFLKSVQLPPIANVH